MTILEHYQENTNNLEHQESQSSIISSSTNTKITSTAPTSFKSRPNPIISSLLDFPSGVSPSPLTPLHSPVPPPQLPEPSFSSSFFPSSSQQQSYQGKIKLNNGAPNIDFNSNNRHSNDENHPFTLLDTTKNTHLSLPSSSRQSPTFQKTQTQDLRYHLIGPEKIKESSSVQEMNPFEPGCNLEISKKDRLLDTVENIAYSTSSAQDSNQPSLTTAHELFSFSDKSVSQDSSVQTEKKQNMQKSSKPASTELINPHPNNSFYTPPDSSSPKSVPKVHENIKSETVEIDIATTEFDYLPEIDISTATLEHINTSPSSSSYSLLPAAPLLPLQEDQNSKEHESALYLTNDTNTGTAIMDVPHSKSSATHIPTHDQIMISHSTIASLDANAENLSFENLKKMESVLNSSSHQHSESSNTLVTGYAAETPQNFVANYTQNSLLTTLQTISLLELSNTCTMNSDQLNLSSAVMAQETSSRPSLSLPRSTTNMGTQSLRNSTTVVPHAQVLDIRQYSTAPHYLSTAQTQSSLDSATANADISPQHTTTTSLSANLASSAFVAAAAVTAAAKNPSALNYQEMKQRSNQVQKGSWPIPEDNNLSTIAQTPSSTGNPSTTFINPGLQTRLPLQQQRYPYPQENIRRSNISDPAKNQRSSSLEENSINNGFDRSIRPLSFSSSIDAAACTSSSSSVSSSTSYAFPSNNENCVHNVHRQTYEQMTGSFMLDQPKKKVGRKRKVDEGLEELSEKKKIALERNRQAAIKCRQRKKEWLASLETKAAYLSQDNELLHQQASSLKEEVLNLKTLLLAHKDCPIALSNGLNVKAIESTLTFQNDVLN